MEPAGTRPEQSSAYQQAMDYAQAKLRQGWGNGVTVLPSPASDPMKGKLNLRVRTLNRPEFGWKKPLEVSVTVLINRVVEGEYSRIPYTSWSKPRGRRVFHSVSGIRQTRP